MEIDMDAKVARRLTVGNKVRFLQDGVLGEVIETGYNAVKIAWADGQVGIIHHDDMQDVSRDLGEEMGGNATSPKLPG
jgi:hypothetical protein